MTDRTAELAATIAATAEMARKLAGARYETTILPWRDLIEATMAVHGCEPLMAIPMLLDRLSGREIGSVGYFDPADARIWLTAAAVDVMEARNG